MKKLKGLFTKEVSQLVSVATRWPPLLDLGSRGLRQMLAGKLPVPGVHCPALNKTSCFSFGEAAPSLFSAMRYGGWTLSYPKEEMNWSN